MPRKHRKAKVPLRVSFGGQLAVTEFQDALQDQKGFPQARLKVCLVF